MDHIFKAYKQQYKTTTLSMPKMVKPVANRPKTRQIMAKSFNKSSQNGGLRLRHKMEHYTITNKTTHGME